MSEPGTVHSTAAGAISYAGSAAAASTANANVNATTMPTRCCRLAFPLALRLSSRFSS